MSGDGGNPPSLRDLLGAYEKSGLVVFLLNFRGNDRIEKLLAALAFYYFIFSGSRTVLIIFLMCMLVFILNKKVKINGVFMIVLLIAVISTLLILSYSPIILHPLLSWSDFLSSLVLKSGNSGQFDQSPDARALMFFHFSDYIRSYWPFGVGSNLLSTLYQGPGGSEMPGIRILAESGVLGLLSICSLLVFSFMKGLGANFFVLTFFVLFFFYGSFLHLYSPVFLAMLSLLNLSREEPRSRNARVG